MTSGSRVPVTGGAGLIGRRMAGPASVGHGERPTVDISAAHALGYQPVHGRQTGAAAAGPDINPNHPGARAGRTRA
jgi:hypothetical protein